MTTDLLSSLDSGKLLDKMESLLTDAGSLLPVQLGVSSIVQLTLFAALGSLILGLVFRIFFGKKCSANQAISASIGILVVYAVTIIIYSLNPLDLSKYLSPLPFVLFRRDILIIVPFVGSDSALVSSQLLLLITLCFIVHFLDSVLPTGKSLGSWLLFRLISIGSALFLNLLVNYTIGQFFADGISAYAPMVLLILLGGALIIGLFNPLLCVVFTVVNPLVGLLYTFFFSSLVGKQLTKAVISALILCFFFFALEVLEYTVLTISASSILGYLPFCIVMLLVWYIFDSKYCD